MSIEGETPGEGGTPAYVTRFDGVRVRATDYHPVWLDSLADDVQSVVIPGSGHYCLEEAPEEVAAALTAFLAPYRG